MSLISLIIQAFVLTSPGNVVMLSEGRPGLDNVYYLDGGTLALQALFVCLHVTNREQPGVLRLELPKEVYERTGLNGQAVRDGGRKHGKARFGIILHCSLHFRY